MDQNTHDAEAEAPVRTAGDVIARLGIPLFLFSAVFAGLLVASRTQLLPILTRINVQGDIVAPEQLEEVEAKMNADLEEAERRRAEMIRPVRDEVYDVLKEYKRTLLSPLDVRDFLEGLAADAGTALDGVVIDRLRLDAVTREVRVHGDVRGVGPGSMTVLAELVDLLRAHPSVHALKAPAFTREDDPGIGFHSPFTLSFIFGGPGEIPTLNP